MDLREALLQATQHFAIPVERQFRVESTDDVELGDRFGIAFARAVPDLVERHRVSLGIFLAFAERAQSATGDADIGRIDVAIDVEIGHFAMHALAHDVRQVADAEQIVRSEKSKAVVEIEPFASQNFQMDRQEPHVVKRRGKHLEGTSTEQKDITGPKHEE